ncbi:hypothetical protein GUITHDRAFT_154367 [Guillardia theta CCMP2712]|uniref:Heme oxygenase n=1 Tax=Guillardia theta (strain CCMP2712) TaxID=905079 RepID=L1IU44_GUITC|nr:hypothetical protein GUITHDRAFT_154367 [Guillardia theta CCMP2712]EKX39766.1 hypothetical protein GUITHDRAFT_154367 [Guillardia theta CCMP2712]|eukprot:XP_005826746.1 hypothetical protein GUITHDRAFT_154367 [Guillardia theta CCMP2712]
MGSDTASGRLTERMRKSTRRIHGKTDRLASMNFALVLTDRALYAKLLGSFYMVYRELEAAMDRCRDNEHVGHVFPLLDKMRRTKAFEADLLFFLGKDWAKTLIVNEAVEKYLARIAELEKKDPALLLAYSYHLYMAFLFGGKVIKKTVSTMLSLRGEEGLAVFAMGGAKPSEYKDSYDELVLSEDQTEELLKESVEVFAMNNNIVMSFARTVTWRNWLASLRNPWVQAVVVAAIGASVALYLSLTRGVKK